ncbi:hypothetical protein [Aquaspirillum sp. LM1]|uniref:hypothetical protein n=1 Tax=Aquaspirillum sp. LM1 TaxID=1938604 RepID=UPI00123717D9|nr:hypothetical protein [Aquaspirillum sp. LM1]
MNLSGVFSYGNLLKTFLPGLLLLCGMVLFTDSYILFPYSQKTQTLITALAKTPAFSIVLIASTSILFGIISNSIHFKWTIPYIGKIFESRNKMFVDFKKAALSEMEHHYAKLLNIPNNHIPMSHNGFDVRAFLLNKTDVVTLQYLRESYWYYMEFQVNSIGASIFLCAASTAYTTINYLIKNISITSCILIVCLMLAFTTLTILIFAKAAYENYEKHEKKYFSFLLGTYHICRFGNIK